MTAVAQSTMLRDEADESLAWAERALAAGRRAGPAAGAAGRAGGEGLGAGRAPVNRRSRGALSWPASSTRPRSSASGYSPPGPSTTWSRGYRRPSRPSTPNCWSGCGSTRSGPASRTSRSPPTTRAGPGWPCSKGDLPGGDRRARAGPHQDRGYRRTGTDVRHSRGVPGRTVPGGRPYRRGRGDRRPARHTRHGGRRCRADFHIACRRHQLVRARALLPDVIRWPRPPVAATASSCTTWSPPR